MEIIDPGGLGFRIEYLWAFLSISGEGDDDEGVVAARINGQWMPLVAADEDRLEALMPIAAKMAEESGVVIKLVRFDTRTEVHTIVPLKERP